MWPRVLEVYSRLIRECEEGQGRLRPNVITFNTLIGAAGNAKEWERALEFMDEMQEWHLRPDKVRQCPHAKRRRHIRSKPPVTQSCS